VQIDLVVSNVIEESPPVSRAEACFCPSWPPTDPDQWNEEPAESKKYNLHFHCTPAHTAGNVENDNEEGFFFTIGRNIRSR